MALSRRRPGGFTLVELLVVVVIIGMLVAIMVPALNQVRQRAWAARCMNYQRELGTAMLAYVTNKDCFPGYINKVGAGRASWVVVLFPYLGRNDLWEVWRGGSGEPVRLEQLVCPADGDASAQSALDALSYQVNSNVCRDRSIDPLQNPTQAAKNKIMLSDITSTTQTPLLSEKRGQTQLLQWTNQTPAILTFTWPQAATTTVGSIVSSAHRGGSHITFCDGHVDFVTDETSCGTPYVYGPVNKPL